MSQLLQHIPQNEKKNIVCMEIYLIDPNQLSGIYEIPSPQTLEHCNIIQEGQGGNEKLESKNI